MYCTSALETSGKMNTAKNRAFIDLCQLRHLNNSEQFNVRFTNEQMLKEESHRFQRNLTF